MLPIVSMTARRTDEGGASVVVRWMVALSRDASCVGMTETTPAAGKRLL